MLLSQNADVILPDYNEFTGFVFKLQANLDPRHRDRLAYIRVVSGRYEKGMKVRVLTRMQDGGVATWKGKTTSPTANRQNVSRSSFAGPTQQDEGQTSDSGPCPTAFRTRAGNCTREFDTETRDDSSAVRRIAARLPVHVWLACWSPRHSLPCSEIRNNRIILRTILA